MADAGENAPDFTLPRDGGGEVSLAEFKGAPVVLYFYPRDDTPGCTTEAVEFTGLGPEFKAAGAQVIGVSKDTVAKHDKFIAKHDLGVILASDAEGDVCERYGVWVEKNMYGKKSMGIERATFLIDAEGRIAKVWRKVKAKGHAAEVLDALRAG
jgi:peroxiredoxin Q/BCP